MSQKELEQYFTTSRLLQDKVCYFGGGLIVLIPKQNINLFPVTAYLNSKEFKVKFTSSGRFKIGHRHISNSVFPF
jgi:hypothetical protein